MGDLFIATNRLNLLELPDAEIYYLPSLQLDCAPSALLQMLIERIPWRSEEVTVWGKRHVQPRLIAWFGSPGCDYKYSGAELSPLPWTDTLSKVLRTVENAADASFNSVLLNYYRNCHDSMGFHSDDEPELGTNPIIASLSVGEERVFTLKHKHRKEMKPVKLRLESGSLLVMKGETQKNWKHAIAKQKSPCGPRVNLTFRRILQADDQMVPS